MNDIPDVPGNARFVVADASGRISLNGTVPRFMLAAQPIPDGGSLVEGAGDPETQYVANGAIVARPASSAALDGMMLTSLPVPCTLTVEGVEHACTDNHCDLSFSHPGVYTVKVSAFPMLDATFEVTQA
jgi:hypothetical protein